MIIYTVFDAHEGTEMAFGKRRVAISFAKDQSPGTIVDRVDIGTASKAAVCAVFNHEGYSLKSERIYETPDA